MIDYNHFQNIMAELFPASKQACVEITHDVKDAVQAQITANGQVVSGFMYGSVYASTSAGSTYGSGIGPPTDDVYLLPEVKPDNELEGVVGVAANYGIYQNDGTRFMPAHPFFEPALERGGDLMDRRLEGVVFKIERAAR